MGDSLSDTVQSKLIKAFYNLNKKITKKGIQLYQVYDAYDIDKDGDMTIKEFTRILRLLDDSFTE